MSDSSVPQTVQSLNSAGGGDLEDLRGHIRENFGESLAPILERVLFQRGWQNCSLDEFYQNLNNNSTTIVAECRRNISENELIISIEENLLRALFMGHGQNAVQMVQALRYYPLEDRFLAMVSPVALAKLLAGLTQARQPVASPVSSNAPQRVGSFTSGPQSPVSGNQQQQQHQPPQQSSVYSSNVQNIPKDTNYPQQPQGSPNHRVQPPTTGNYTSYGSSAQGQQMGSIAAPAPTTTTPTTHTANAGNSWGIGGNGNGPTQQLSPYPNNRQQPNHQGNQHSNNHHMQQNQQQNQQHMPQSYGSNNGGPQFPQTNSFESEGSHGGPRRVQQQHHHQQQHQYLQQPAPPAPAPVFYEGGDPHGAPPPNAIGSTPTSHGAPSHANHMSWADEAEQEEFNKQQRERDEKELKEFLEAHKSNHLFNAVKKYSLSQLRSLSPKVFETELKRLICSSSARKSLMDLLHPNGVYPEEPPERVEQDEPGQFPLQQDPAQRQHQQAMAARHEAVSRKNQGTTYGKDVATTNALLDTLKLGGSADKGGRGKRTGVHDEHASPNSKGSVGMAGGRGGGKASGQGPAHTLGGSGSQLTSPSSSSMNSRLFFDDDPAYQQQNQQQHQQHPAPRPSAGSAKREVNPRNQRVGKNGQSDSDFTPTSSPAKGGRSGGNAVPNSTLVIRGLRGIPLEAVSVSVGRLAQVVDYKQGYDDDEAEFIIGSYNSELTHARFINVRHQQHTTKARVHAFKKGTASYQEHGHQQPAQHQHMQGTGGGGRGGHSAPHNANHVQGVSPGLCKYYTSAQGCHRGEHCKFLHADASSSHGKFKGGRGGTEGRGGGEGGRGGGEGGRIGEGQSRGRGGGDRSEGHIEHGRGGGGAGSGHQSPTEEASAPAPSRGKKNASNPNKPRALQERDVTAPTPPSLPAPSLPALPSTTSSPQQEAEPASQPPQLSPTLGEGTSNGGSRPGSNLPSPQKKVSTPLDEIPKPRSFQEAMRGSSRNSPIPSHPGGSPNGQGHKQYPTGTTPQYSQAPPPNYGAGHEQAGSHPQTPVYEEAKHHTVPNHVSTGSPTQAAAPQFQQGDAQ